MAAARLAAWWLPRRSAHRPRRARAARRRSAARVRDGRRAPARGRPAPARRARLVGVRRRRAVGDAQRVRRAARARGRRARATSSARSPTRCRSPARSAAGIVGVLLAFGVEADLALVSVLAYRAVAIWLPAPDRPRRARRACGARSRAGSAEDRRRRRGRTPAVPPRRRRAAPAARHAARPVPEPSAPVDGMSRGMTTAPARAAASRARAARSPSAARAALLALVRRGVVQPPDLEERADRPLRHARRLDLRARRRRSRSSRPARSSASSRRARPRSCSAAWSPPQGDVDARRSCCSIAWVAAALGRPRELLRSAAGSAGASSSRHGAAPRRHRRRGSRASTAFFDRHGAKAILIGRFVGIVRAVAPFLAGSSGHAPARVPAVEPARHRRLGDRLHARRLRSSTSSFGAAADDARPTRARAGRGRWARAGPSRASRAARGGVTGGAERRHPSRAVAPSLGRTGPSRGCCGTTRRPAARRAPAGRRSPPARGSSESGSFGRPGNGTPGRFSYSLMTTPLRMTV